MEFIFGMLVWAAVWILLAAIVVRLILWIAALCGYPPPPPIPKLMWLIVVIIGIWRLVLVFFALARMSTVL